MTFLVASAIQNTPFNQPLSVLLDTGSSSSWFNRLALPENVNGKTVPEISGSTLAGSFKSNQEITLTDVVLPVLHRNMSLPEVKARIFNSPCRYDIILGRDACTALRIILDFDNHDIVSCGARYPMMEFPSVEPHELPHLRLHRSISHSTCPYQQYYHYPTWPYS